MGFATVFANDIIPVTPEQDLQAQQEYLSQHPVLTAQNVVTDATPEPVYADIQQVLSRHMGDTEIFCHVIHNGSWGSTKSYGVYPMNPTDPATLGEAFFKDSYLSSAGGMAIVGNTLYCVAPDLRYSGYGIVNIYLYTYNTDTWQGSRTNVNKWGNYMIATATAQTTDGRVFGQFYTPDLKNYELGEADYANGTRTCIAPCDGLWVALAAGNDGYLYAINQNADLLKVDPETGVTNTVGNTGRYLLEPAPNEGKTYMQSAVVDPATGIFYWAATFNDASCRLLTVDLETAKSEILATYEDGQVEIGAMVILPPKAAMGAPDEATDIEVNFNEGATKGTVTFNAPTETFGGEPLSGELDYRVNVNGELATSGKAECGKRVTTAEFTAPEGEATIEVYLDNKAGASPRAAKNTWIGFDVPGVPANLKYEIAENGKNATLTWDAAAGSHNGYTGDLTYEIVRIQNNIRLVAGTVKNATSFTDNLPAFNLGELSYQVRATNAAGSPGEYAQGNTIVAGNPFEIPYHATFEVQSNHKLFTIIDNNKDNYSWYWNGNLFYNGMATQVDGDDWLITPAIKLESGYTYELTCVVENQWGDEQRLEIAFGKEATVEGMSEIITEAFDFTGKETVTATFTPDADGYYHVGFHALSKPRNYYLAILSIDINYHAAANAPAAVEDLTAVAGEKGAFNTVISFTLPTKSADGNNLSSISRVVIKNGPDVVKEITGVTPGQKLSINDDKVHAGINSYVVIPFNENGVGVSVSRDVYVGEDTPGAPQGLTRQQVAGETTLFAWDGYAPGANGGYINPDNITTKLYSVSVNSWQYEDVAHSDLLATSTGPTLSFGGDPDEGEPSFQAWAVTHSNNYGEGKHTIIAGPTGRPYALPFRESFANGAAKNIFWPQFIRSQYSFSGIWYLTKSTDANPDYNGDGGFYKFSVTDLNAAYLNTLKIEMGNIQNPTLMFAEKRISGADGILKVEAAGPDGQWKEVFAKEYGNSESTDWNLHKISLDAVKGERWITLRFAADGDKQFDGAIDNIIVADVADNNLAVTATAPDQVKTGVSIPVNITVENSGKNDVTSFDVEISCNGKSVATQTVEAALSNFDTHSFKVEVPTNAASKGENEIAVKITTPDDRMTDNAATIAVDVVESTHPKVFNLKYEQDGTGAVVTWEAPEATSYEFTEDFEQYAPFAISGIGEWTMIDDDPLPLEGWSGLAYDNKFGPYAFIVANPEHAGMNLAVQSGFAPHSGNQYLSSFMHAASQGSDPHPVSHWVVSPKLSGEAQTIRFFACRPGDDISKKSEPCEVYYSTTDADKESFTLVNTFQVGHIPDGHGNWGEEYQFEVPEGTRYFALRHNSQGTRYLHSPWELHIDDVTYRVDPGAPVAFRVYVDGEFAQEVKSGGELKSIVADVKDHNTVAVTAVYPDGEESEATEVTLSESGVEAVDVFGAGPVDVYDVSGRMVLRQARSFDGLAAGVYVIKGEKFIVK